MTLATLLFDILRGVSQAIVVVVKDRTGKDIDTIVFICITPQQRPLEVTPYSFNKSEWGEIVLVNELRT